MPAMQGRTCAIFDGVASRSRRENAMAVRALLHYALEIPDLSVGEKFYRNFGLADKAAQDEAIHLRPAQQPRESVASAAATWKNCCAGMA
jgi:hypothetical protein